jgi:hypothetical protein
MNPDRFVKVFDVVDAGFKDWTFPAFGLIFVVIGTALAFFPAAIRTTGIPYLQVHTGFRKVFPYIFLSFAVLWTVAMFAATYSKHLQYTSMVQGNGCRVVEGAVEHFVPMPYGGHAVESFSVSGTRFAYSDFLITGGFNNTASHGGPISGGAYVRICYDPSSNVILRLEIRDFEPAPKEDARSDWRLFFQTIGSLPVQLPWYADLIFLLYLLDVVAMRALFLPYLRTFFRIKTVSDWDRALPGLLEAEKKINLRNSMIYWSRDDQAIWLRPRGLNLIAIPSMVAKLMVDAGERSLLGCEIRFSSGFPLLLALMLWTAYRFFTAIPGNAAIALSPLAITAMGAFMAVITWINLWILRSRMEKLVEDAVAELNGM